jgi:hypothetical protein
MTSPLLASLAKDLGVNVTDLKVVVRELAEVQNSSEFRIIAACRNNPKLAQSVKATALKLHATK